MIREELIINGEIDEGGIRYFIQMNASILGITGYVKKGSNGNVIAEIQGDKNKIEKLKAKIKLGNGFFKVMEIRAKNINTLSEKESFLIK